MYLLLLAGNMHAVSILISEILPPVRLSVVCLSVVMGGYSHLVPAGTFRVSVLVVLCARV